MSEWFKYGVSGLKWLLGFVGAAAIFNEVKSWLGKRRMREQLYTELVENYEKLANRRHDVTSVEGIKRGSAGRFHHDLNLRFTVFDHYENSDKSAFFKLAEAGAISAIYARYHDLDLMAQNDWGEGFEANRAAMKALAEFDKQVRTGRLKMGLLSRVSHPKIFEYLSKVKNGELASFEKDIDPLS